MKIGILGSGAVGKALAVGFASEGNDVILGTREPGADKIQQWLSANTGIKAGSF